jgi:hypothetical protein
VEENDGGPGVSAAKSRERVTIARRGWVFDATSGRVGDAAAVIPSGDTDLLFKKPFTLSDTVEFMVGVGPEWTYTSGGVGKVSTEVALDFMFWPWPDRKFGWFVEPSCSYSVSSGHEQSLGVSVGLLIPIR